MMSRGNFAPLKGRIIMANTNGTTVGTTATEDTASKANVVRVIFRGAAFPGSPEVELSKGQGLHSDGTIDVDTAGALISEFMTSHRARCDADQETGKVELDAMLSLKSKRAWRQAPIGEYVKEIMKLRIAKATRAFLAENPDADDDETATALAAAPGCGSDDSDRLLVILGGIFRSDPDRFYMGKRNGVLVRYVPGEVATDKNGKPVYDGEGAPVPHTRWSDEDWAKATHADDNAA